MPSHTDLDPPSPLRKRARALSEQELNQIPWLKGLTPEERERAQGDLMVTQAQAGDYLCRIGRPVTYWFRLIEGLLKMSNDDSQGPVITFTGVAPGGWFGEGTVLKHLENIMTPCADPSTPTRCAPGPGPATRGSAR